MFSPISSTGSGCGITPCLIRLPTLQAIAPAPSPYTQTQLLVHFRHQHHHHHHPNTAVPVPSSPVLPPRTGGGGNVMPQDNGGGSSGLSGLQKARIVIGVLAGTGVVGFAAMVYMKRRNNIQ